MNTTSNTQKKSRCEIKKQRKKRGRGMSDEDNGGYMAIYHNIEEMNYGPQFGMPAKWRVFLCIRHKLLRDGLCEKHIGTAFLMEKTSLTKAQIKSALKALIADGLIISTQNMKELSNGHLVYGENSYSLNPYIFGEYYNWYKNNPTVRVYEGSEGRSYSVKGPVPNVEPGGVSDVEPGGVSDVEPGKKLNYSELIRKIQSKNPSSKNPYKEPLVKNEILKSEEEIVEENRRKYLSQKKQLGI